MVLDGNFLNTNLLNINVRRPKVSSIFIEMGADFFGCVSASILEVLLGFVNVERNDGRS